MGDDEFEARLIEGSRPLDMPGEGDPHPGRGLS
jgi:hypothetical protein